MRAATLVPGLLSSAVACLLAPSALAATSASVPAGGGLGALSVSVDVASRTVRYATCMGEPCSVSLASPSVAIPASDAPLEASAVTVLDVPLAGGRHLVHVKALLAPVGPESLAWEGLFAAGAQAPLFAGLTGWSRGEPGERSGTDVRFLAGEGHSVVVVGDIREDLRVCGDDATLLDPRGLDPATLVFHGATLQRLSQARRDAAVPLTATPRHGSAEAPLARLLLATEASSATGPAAALTDGDPTTAWSEARPGRGQGEFVQMLTPYDVPIVRFTATITPAKGDKPRAPEGAAPETFYLATNAGTYAVTMPEDAWAHPGEAYDVALPVPLSTSCVALVLGDAFTRGHAHPEVTVAELTAYSGFDHAGASLAEVAAALGGGDARAGAAAALLERAGAPGIAAMRDVYPKLDPAGRALAMSLLASAPSCEGSAPLFTEALADPDEVVRGKALAKLEQPTCGREALPALLAGLRSDTTRAKVAPLVALVGREKALAALVAELGPASPEGDHPALRSATAYAARGAAPEELAALLQGAASRAPGAALDALRSFRERLGDMRPAADGVVQGLLDASPPMGTRYLLVDVLATLAAGGDAPSAFHLAELATKDPSPEVRARAAGYLAHAAQPDAVLAHALTDDAPRVREAALRSAASARMAAAAGAATTLLAKDPWSFVRVAAAGALGGIADTAAADRALTDALDQLSPRVREQAILALGAHGPLALGTAGEKVQHHLVDPKEEGAVRAAAAVALGRMCDAKAVEDLTRLAVGGASSPDAGDVALGLVATEALGVLHPSDLAKRFEPMAAKGVRPDARAAAARAVAAAGGCAGR